MAQVHTVDARWAVFVVKRLKALRIATDPLLKTAGLTRSQATDPDAKIPFHKHAALLTLAAEATGDDCFGINLSLEVRPQQMGVLGYILLNSATLGDALSHLHRYHRVLSDGWDVGLRIEDRSAAILGHIVDPLVENERQAAEIAASLLLRYCQVITGKEITPLGVEFRHPKPKAARRVEQRFLCPVRFGQDRVALILRRQDLDLEASAADNELLKILKRHCREILGRAPGGDDLGFSVRELVTGLLPSGHPKIDEVARELGMSARTLRRRLAAQDLVYRDLVDDVRRRLAIRYLKDERISLKQVTYLLGYSDLA
ncbi:MAG: AraC family transcriptional regulator ligand-binding domain-containing protein, partial [Kiloniellales bacterium]|nr:AraC family transcriptional regulator ligand-binding domain-containing protein [Kiloniellales bacterium]